MSEPAKQESASWFVIGSVVVICAVMASYVVDRYTNFNLLSPFSGGKSSLDGAPEGSMQHAVDACKRVATIQLGPSLLQMRMDSISTRYLSSKSEYVVFLNVIIKSKERTAYYFECNVSAKNQAVSRTRLTGPPGSFSKIELK